MPKYKVTFKEQNGEQDYYHDEIFDAANYDHAGEGALRYLKDQLGGELQDDGYYWIGDRIISIYGISETHDIKDNFTEEELVEILEVARVSLNNDNVFEEICDKLDISHHVLHRHLVKLQQFMNPEVKA